MTRLLLPALSLCALAACSSTPKDSPAPAQPGEDPAAAPQAGEAAADTSELEQKLTYAQAELAIAEVGAAARLTKAERGVVVAEEALAAANEELESYKGMEVEREKEAAKLSVDRAQHSLILATQSAEALRIQFAREEEAMSEDPVLQKTERELVFAQRAHAQAQRARNLKVDIEIPRKQRRLEQARATAEAGLEAARLELQRTRMSIELELLRKTHAVEAAETKLTEASGVVAEEEGGAE